MRTQGRHADRASSAARPTQQGLGHRQSVGPVGRGVSLVGDADSHKFALSKLLISVDSSGRVMRESGIVQTRRHGASNTEPALTR
jgi:hypothetical protein